jgi:hypothetical protein
MSYGSIILEAFRLSGIFREFTRRARRRGDGMAARDVFSDEGIDIALKRFGEYRVVSRSRLLRPSKAADANNQPFDPPAS